MCGKHDLVWETCPVCGKHVPCGKHAPYVGNMPHVWETCPMWETCPLCGKQAPCVKTCPVYGKHVLCAGNMSHMWEICPMCGKHAPCVGNMHHVEAIMQKQYNCVHCNSSISRMNHLKRHEGSIHKKIKYIVLNVANNLQEGKV